MNARKDRGEAPLAWALVASIHLLGAWWVLRPVRDIARQDAPMQLVLVTLQPARPPAPHPMPAPAAPQPRDAPTREQDARSRGRARQASAQAQAHAATPAQTGEARPLVLRPVDDGLRFQRDPLVDRRGSIQPLPRGRFRMREAASIAGVVRGVAQSLFWPPGYSDDPCSGLPEAVEKFSGARTERERELLADAVRERDRYCRR